MISRKRIATGSSSRFVYFVIWIFSYIILIHVPESSRFIYYVIWIIVYIILMHILTRTVPESSRFVYYGIWIIVYIILMHISTRTVPESSRFVNFVIWIILYIIWCIVHLTMGTWHLNIFVNQQHYSCSFFFLLDCAGFHLNLPVGMCARRRLRSVCASAQADLSLQWALYG